MADYVLRRWRAPLQDCTDEQLRELPVGRHNFGLGMSLIVLKSGSRSWSGRITVRGKQRTYGLGAWPAVPEGDARKLWLVSLHKLEEAGLASPRWPAWLVARRHAP